MSSFTILSSFALGEPKFNIFINPNIVISLRNSIFNLDYWEDWLEPDRNEDGVIYIPYPVNGI